MASKKRSTPRKRRAKSKLIEGAGTATMITVAEDGVVFTTVAVAYTFTFRTLKLQASIAILPDMVCPSCEADGIIFVNGQCVRCRDDFSRVLCLRAYGGINDKGVLTLDPEALLCTKCVEGEKKDANQLPLNLGTAPERMKARWN